MLYIYINKVWGSQNDQHSPTASSREDGHTRHDLSSFYTMSNHTPNGIRAHNNRHAIANDPDNLHAMSNHTQNDTQGAHPRTLQGERWARPRPVWYASRPEPCAIGAQPGTLAPLCPGHIAP